ncbi:MAG: hypothetical protein COX57_02300 [Alphaproteobacteria bacterium CG_4_10_14_0_2_um_filter_63_37]|nr:MAG: hypothetical protein COX57_02300 [Alphaproteobacteria bacterium CG_4_10_14_0_2_um_filter_63_37]
MGHPLNQQFHPFKTLECSMNKIVKAVGFYALLSLVSACATVVVEQGSIMPQEVVDQIHAGMNQDQVAKLIGHPLEQNPLHPDQWEYFYQRGGDLQPVTAWVVVHFDAAGLVTQVETSGPLPEGQGIKPGYEAQ